MTGTDILDYVIVWTWVHVPWLQSHHPKWLGRWIVFGPRR